MRLLTFSILFGFCLLFFRCSVEPEKKTVLIPVDLSDSAFAELRGADTLTKGGWIIRYFCSSDSAHCNDVYVLCSRDTVQETWCCREILERKERLPRFSMETPDAIYFTFGDTAHGADLLVFSKESNEKFREYRDVIRVDYQQGVVLYLSEKALAEGNRFELMLGDIPNMKRHRIPYKYACTSADKSAPVDSMIVDAKEVSIMTTLFNQKKIHKQTRVITR